MTNIELQFMNVVPSALRDIAKALQQMNDKMENKVASQPETSSKNISETTMEKLSWLLSSHYNMFHADMILRAAFDESISQTDFLRGCVDIHQSEKNDGSDEFTPVEFKNV